MSPKKRKRPFREGYDGGERLAKGVVILRRFLSDEEQQELCHFGLSKVRAEKPARNEVLKNMRQLTLGNKKSDLLSLPPGLASLATEATRLAQTLAPGELRELQTPRTCVLNWYDPSSRLGMHVDKQGSVSGIPVVSFSVGDRCDFCWKRGWSKKEAPRTVELASGDVLLFGGPAEGIVHGVPKIHPGTAPRWLQLKGRLNVTLRSHAA